MKITNKNELKIVKNTIAPSIYKVKKDNIEKMLAYLKKIKK